MPDHRPNRFNFKLIACLGMSLLVFGLARSGLAAAVHFKELIPFVDIKIPGWTMQGKPCGTTVKQGKMVLSEARASFKAGDQTLEVIVLDFSGKPIPFVMMPQMEMETSEETVRTAEVQGCKALETFRAKNKHGELNISVANRFWVKIEGEGIDNLQVLRDVAQQLDLKKLATLAK
jgi:hypothetical protein